MVGVPNGDFGFSDSSSKRFKRRQSFVAELTVRVGKVVWDLNGLASDDWNARVLSCKQTSQRGTPAAEVYLLIHRMRQTNRCLKGRMLPPKL
jgi:hypothetical protein